MTRSVHRPIYSSVSTLAQEIQHHHILPAMRPLSVLLAMPGRKIVFSVLPLALGGGAVGVWALQGGSHCTTTAKADAVVSSALSDGGKGNGSTQPAAAVVQAGSSPTLPNLLAKLGLGGNEFANGGLALMLVGAAAAGARVVLSSALRYCKRHVMVQAEIDSRDDAYRWVMHWLSKHPKFVNATSVSVTTNLTGTFGTSIPAIASSAAAADAGGGNSGPPVTFLPAPGDHLLSYKGRWMCISRQRSSGNPQLAANARLLMETLRISMLGTNRQPIEALIAEAATAYTASQSCRTAVHSVDQDGYWTQVGSRPIRPLDTVVLQPGQAESLLADCQEFLASEAWYAHHGIPFRRGYLFYGPPGTGKTSMAMALAGALGLEIYVVTLSSPTMTDEALRGLLNTAGTKSILLLEDVDAAFVDRTANQGGGRLTFSGLLNALDGVAAQEGRLLFMTTNHIERLSSALIRPGRVDVRCYLGPATREQAKQMFVSFYRDLPMQLALRGRSASGAFAPAAAGAGAGAGADTADEQAGRVEQQVDNQGAAGALEQESAPLLHRALSAKEQQDREAGLLALAEEFAAKLPAEPHCSTAQLQAFLMSHRLAPGAAVSQVEAWLAEQQRAETREAAPGEGAVGGGSGGGGG